MTQGNQAQRYGEVFDLGYQQYAGAREGRWRARRSLFWDGVRTSFGLGRGAFSKFLSFLLIGIISAPAIFFVVITAFISQFEDTGGGLDGFRSVDYYGYAYFPLLIFAAVVGPELLTPDRRYGVISLYLVRPITVLDYAVSRWAAFLVVSLAVVYAPQLLLFFSTALSQQDIVQWTQDNWLTLPRFLASGFVLAAFTTTVAMAVSSFTTRRPVATGAILALVFVGSIVVELASVAAGEFGQWLTLLDSAMVLPLVNNWIFGLDVGRVNDFDGPVYFAAVMAYTFVAGAVYLWRYRKLKA
ncbi:MAG: hypothetical protein WD208_10225 [Dehalococcoidia bacterium]